MPNVLSIFFPLQQGATSFPRTSSTEDEAIRASVLQILTTSMGERVMRGSFGISLHDQVFENDSDSMHDTIVRKVVDALSKWEPRVRVTKVAVETDEVTEPDVVTLTVEYTVISSGSPGSVTIAT